jgi:hypothetical protein
MYFSLSLNRKLFLPQSKLRPDRCPIVVDIDQYKQFLHEYCLIQFNFKIHPRFPNNQSRLLILTKKVKTWLIAAHQLQHQRSRSTILV